MAKRGTAEVLTGAAVLLIAAGFLVYAVAHSGRSPTRGYELHAQFDHVDGLSVGSDVRIAGVKVGSVLQMGIDPQSYLANVTFTVRDSIRLPKDTGAEVTSDGLLGGKFLNLSPGGDTEELAPGGKITVTQSSISLEQLLGKFIFSGTGLADKTKEATPPAPAKSGDNAGGNGANNGPSGTGEPK
jgi:phospholipid/cholesterol/gamma-HCH transport system substrate-binding protein